MKIFAINRHCDLRCGEWIWKKEDDFFKRVEEEVNSVGKPISVQFFLKIMIDE